MSLTSRQLNRATLARQLLLKRKRIDVVEAVRRIVAMQAQEPASPYLALWNRVANFDPADLDRAFADHSIVKATLIRITMHAVHADDYSAFHNAMVPNLRASRLTDRRFEESRLSSDEALGLVPPLLTFAGKPRSKAEIEDMLEKRLGDRRPRVWWALRTFAPLMHVPTGGPWSFGSRTSYVAPRMKMPLEARDASFQWLVRRYLEAFGPATVADICQFALLRRPVVRKAIEALGEAVITLEGPNGGELFDVPGGRIPKENTPAPPRLLPMWDSVLLAYADRSRLIAEDYRKVVNRINGDVLPTLLVDGYVAGVWRPVDGGIEATAFHKLSSDAWHGLEREAAALVAFLADRDPTVYRRYAHWWKTLPSAEVRILAR